MQQRQKIDLKIIVPKSLGLLYLRYFDSKNKCIIDSKKYEPKSEV